jgi:hypothetical protein
VHSYARAAQVYYSNEGKWPDSFDVLDIDAPGGMTIASNTYKSGVCATNDKLYCCVNEFQEGVQAAAIVCGIADYKFAYQYKFDNSSRYCYGKNGTIGEKLCKTMNGTLSSGNLPTPVGHKMDYTVYKI